MPTLGGRLDELRWWFFEKGGQVVWRELKRFVDAPANALLTLNDPHGDNDYAANCEPDIDQTTADHSAGREGQRAAGTDPLYPQAKFPSRLAGFGS